MSYNLAKRLTKNGFPQHFRRGLVVYKDITKQKLGAGYYLPSTDEMLMLVGHEIQGIIHHDDNDWQVGQFLDTDSTLSGVTADGKTLLEALCNFWIKLGKT